MHTGEAKLHTGDSSPRPGIKGGEEDEKQDKSWMDWEGANGMLLRMAGRCPMLTTLKWGGPDETIARIVHQLRKICPMLRLSKKNKKKR